MTLCLHFLGEGEDDGNAAGPANSNSKGHGTDEKKSKKKSKKRSSKHTHEDGNKHNHSERTTDEQYEYIFSILDIYSYLIEKLI
jgi:hypothetical protein